MEVPDLGDILDFRPILAAHSLGSVWVWDEWMNGLYIGLETPWLGGWLVGPCFLQRS